MAIFGTIVLFLFGIWVLVTGTVCAYAAAAFSGKGFSFMLFPLAVGGAILYLACKYGAFSLSVA